jgi:hypothetical protein
MAHEGYLAWMFPKNDSGDNPYLLVCAVLALVTLLGVVFNWTFVLRFRKAGLKLVYWR